MYTKGKCTRRANVHGGQMSVLCMSISTGSKLTVSLLVFVRGVNGLKVTNYLFKQWDTHPYNTRHLTRGLFTVPRSRTEAGKHSSDTHRYNTRHLTRGLFTVPRSRTEAGKHTVLNRAMIMWNSLSPKVTQGNLF
jgi:hypothetical protein